MSNKPAKKKVAKKAAKKVAALKKVEKVETKPTPISDSCSACRYFKGIDEKVGTCRRYPSPPGIRHQSTMPTDGWCGEFSKAK